MLHATIALLAFAGCAGDSAYSIGAGDRLVVTWSTFGTSDSVNAPKKIACTAVVSHPCPFLVYTHELVVTDDGLHLLWDAATGAADSNGIPVEMHSPFDDVLMLDDVGAIVLEQRGDDGGLRRVSYLVPNGHGFAGSVTWTLFNVPGNTTFTVTAEI